MKRTIIKIDEDLCNGCGQCVQGCHEGALQIIDDKARLISDLFCDGLGACIGECPVGAIELEEREAEPYDETLVMEKLAPKGAKTILAHLRHLRDHNEMGFLEEGLAYIERYNVNVDISEFKNPQPKQTMEHAHHHHGGGCPGSRSMDFRNTNQTETSNASLETAPSELRQWPVQMHLVNPAAGYFKNADLLLAADCVAFSMGNFHSKYLKGKALGIACPKLDANKEIYVSKLTAMIDESKINTLTVMIMEVPCCGGLEQVAKMAVAQASRKVPIKVITVGLQGDIVNEEWV